MRQNHLLGLGYANVYPLLVYILLYKENKAELTEEILENLKSRLKKSAVYILVGSRPVVLVKINSPYDVFSNYQVSNAITADIVTGTDFQEK